MRADARRNRERLLRSAANLFATEGLSVPLDEIARHAGVGPGTVHRHFPTKEALFAALVVDRVRATVEYGRSLIDAVDPWDALMALLGRMLEEGHASVTLKAALAGTDFDLRVAAPRESGELQDAVSTLLARAQRAGLARADLSTSDAMALVAGAFAAVRHAGAETDPGRARRLVTTIFGGFRNPSTGLPGD